MTSTKKILDDCFLIAIKFDCKETCAFFYNPKKTLLEILPGQMTVESSIAIISMDGKLVSCIGDSAIQHYAIAEYYQRYFEKFPSEMDDSEIYLLTEFLKGVYNSILDRYPDFKTRKHYVVLVPPSVSHIFNVESRAYFEIAKKAGLPIISVQEYYTSLLAGSMLLPWSSVGHNLKDVLYINFRENRLHFSYCDTINEILSPSKFGVYPGYADLVNDVIASYYRTTERESANKFFKLYGWNKESNCFRLFRDGFLRSIAGFYQYYDSQSRLGIMLDYSFYTLDSSTHIDGFDGFSCFKDTGVLRVYQEQFKQKCSEFKKEIGSLNPSYIFLIGDYGFDRYPFLDIIQSVYNESTIVKSYLQNEEVLHGASYLTIKGYEPSSPTPLKMILNYGI